MSGSLDKLHSRYLGTLDSSLNLYEVPENTAGYENVTWWGAEVTDKDQKNLKGKLPFISSYLNTTVKNRYLLPIATSSIADSQGKLSNSYGY